VGPRPGLGDMEKRKYFTLSGLKLRPLGPSAHSQSRYTDCATALETVINNNNNNSNKGHNYK
jgi:hypothetical protein